MPILFKDKEDQRGNYKYTLIREDEKRNRGLATDLLVIMGVLKVLSPSGNTPYRECIQDRSKKFEREV